MGPNVVADPAGRRSRAPGRDATSRARSRAGSSAIENRVEERRPARRRPRHRSRRPATPRPPHRRARRPPTADAPADRRGSSRWTTPPAHSAVPLPPAATRVATTATSENVNGIGAAACAHDLDGMHPLVGHHVVGDLGGHRLDQIPRRPGDDVGGTLGQHAVVHGVGEVVAGGRRLQIDPHRDVDDEVLAVAALMVEDAVIATNGQARATRFDQPSRSDVTLRPQCLPRPRPRRARRPMRARRAPGHPTHRCQPASAEITAVAVSRPPGGRGSPSGPASSVPRNRFREAPTRTGIPVGTNSGSA